MSEIKKHLLLTLTGLALAVLYLVFAYLLEREDFALSSLVYGGTFALSLIFCKLGRQKFWVLVASGIVFRLLLLVALPNLSQDFYRFIWDGHILLDGINPYIYSPEMLVKSQQITPLMQELYNGMGSLSAGHFSNYPPLNQLLFLLAAWVGGKSLLGSVVVMRIIIILADLGILYFGTKLLDLLRLDRKAIFIYFLNPFVILELSGNLHFEGVMLLFLIASLYLLHQKKWIWAAVLFGLSVSVKLLPLLFMPLFYRFFVEKGLFNRGFWKLKWFFWIALAVVVLGFAPFYSEDLIGNYSHTIGLWFNKFEFNASVFYVIRWIGYEVNGWDPIGTAGKVLPLIVVGIILLLALLRDNRNTRSLVGSMLFAVTAYLFLSTTVHPWYLATPLLLSVFTGRRYVLVWTLTVFLSYAAYAREDYSENLWLVGLEYLIVGIWFVWELCRSKRQTPLPDY